MGEPERLGHHQVAQQAEGARDKSDLGSLLPRRPRSRRGEGELS